MALKISEHCGKTSFEHLIEYGPKQPCYEEVARTKDSLSNWWFVAEFENPNSLKTCLEMDGTDYKDHKLKVRSLTSKEYDEICGLFDITKARTKRIKKEMKGKRLTLILASNVSSRVTSDALYKFFSFPGDPVEVTMDRARKIAMIAYDTEEQGVLALACDQAILGPAMVRIELYRPEKHGKDLQFLLKVGHTGDIAHVGAQTGYVQINERAAPPVPANQQHLPPAHVTHQVPQMAPSAAQGQKYPPGYPPGYSQAPAPHVGKPEHIATHYNPQSLAPTPTRGYAAPPAGGHGNSANPFSLSAAAPPSSSHAPSSHIQNPISQPSAQQAHSQSPNPYAQMQPPSGRPEPSQKDWSSIVPTAKYTVTTEVQK